MPTKERSLELVGGFIFAALVAVLLALTVFAKAISTIFGVS